MEIFWSIRAYAGLNSSQKSQTFLGSLSIGFDNASHQDVLRLVKCVWKVLHAVCSTLQTLSVEKDEFLDSVLLEVSERLDVGADGGTCISDSCEVVGGNNCATASVVNESNAFTFYFANHSILGNSNMGSAYDETVAIIRFKGSHGSETSVSCKRRCREGLGKDKCALFLVLIFDLFEDFVFHGLRRSARPSVGSG